jgi:hypothetical protein
MYRDPPLVATAAYCRVARSHHVLLWLMERRGLPSRPDRRDTLPAGLAAPAACCVAGERVRGLPGGTYLPARILRSRPSLHPRSMPRRSGPASARHSFRESDFQSRVLMIRYRESSRLRPGRLPYRCRPGKDRPVRPDGLPRCWMPRTIPATPVLIPCPGRACHRSSSPGRCLARQSPVPGRPAHRLRSPGYFLTRKSPVPARPERSSRPLRNHRRLSSIQNRGCPALKTAGSLNLEPGNRAVNLPRCLPARLRVKMPLRERRHRPGRIRLRHLLPECPVQQSRRLLLEMHPDLPLHGLQ